MYTALVADGSQIPPVIFTSDSHVREGTEGEREAFIEYIPNLSPTPSASITLRWLDRVKDYLSDEPHLIHDSGGEFKAKLTQEHLTMEDIESHTIPAAGGAYLNPCDNNFHHDMKQYFYKKKRTTHEEMLRAMIDAYYDVPDKNILHYFKHCRIIGKMLTRKYICKLLSEGYHPGKTHKEDHQKCVNAYNGWKKNIRFVNNDVRSDRRGEVINNGGLDGVYWHVHCRN
jgi:hypothetical protein